MKKVIKEILSSWFEYGPIEDGYFSELEGHGFQCDIVSADQIPPETEEEAKRYNAMIHRIILMDCYGYTRDDLYLFNLEDAWAGKITDDALEKLKKITERAEKWRRRKNYAMFVSYYSKNAQVDVCRDVSALSKFLVNHNVQLEEASFL